MQDFDAFQCAQNSNISVVVPAMRNRINVRTEQNYRKVRITPFPVANDVSGRVDTDFSPAFSIKDLMYLRPSTSASLNATRLTPPSRFAPNAESSWILFSIRFVSARKFFQAAPV